MSEHTPDDYDAMAQRLARIDAEMDELANSGLSHDEIANRVLALYWERVELKARIAGHRP
jgi:hypothetical protein